MASWTSRRLREYVASLRAIWASWQAGTPLDYRGRFYQFTLMTTERSLESFEMRGSNFLVWGPTDAAVSLAREQVRRRAAFYASTRAYAPVLEQHGLHELGPALRKLIAAQRWEELVTLVSDDVLDLFCIAGVYEEIADKVQEQLGGLVDRVHLSLPRDSNPADLKRAERAVEALHALPNARLRRTAQPVTGVVV